MVLDKLVSLQVTKFIEKKSLLDKFQTGYWADHITTVWALKPSGRVFCGASLTPSGGRARFLLPSLPRIGKRTVPARGCYGHG